MASRELSTGRFSDLGLFALFGLYMAWERLIARAPATPDSQGAVVDTTGGFQ